MEMLSAALALLVKLLTIAGALYALWGVVNLALALRNSQGTEQRDALLQIVGGVMVGAAGGLTTYIAL